MYAFFDVLGLHMIIYCPIVATIGWDIASPNLYWPCPTLRHTPISIFTCIIYDLGIKMQRNAH